ncbi:hypothetical protein OFC47_24925, partial [Escherichia coli]|nr:hypothetical protein [Escherichia coli]
DRNITIKEPLYTIFLYTPPPPGTRNQTTTIINPKANSRQLGGVLRRYNELGIGITLQLLPSGNSNEIRAIIQIYYY